MNSTDSAPEPSFKFGGSSSAEIYSPDKEFAQVRSYRLNVLIRYLLLISGAAFLIGTVLNVNLQGWLGSSAASSLLPLFLGGGFLFTGLVAGTAWQRFAALFTLSLAGQTASLLMIDAGRLIHFQHYRPILELFAEHRLAFLIVCIQTLVTAAASFRYLKPAAAWIRENLSTWQLVALAMFLALAGAAVTPALDIYLNSILISAWMQFLGLVSVGLVVAAVPSTGIEWCKGHLEKWATDDVSIKKRRLDGFAAAAALWVVLLSALLGLVVYQAHPHVPDETQYAFQARYMAAGQLTVKPPLVPDAFSMYMVPHQESRWYGIFSPGWPALLAIGELAGLPWLVNPLLAGFCVLLTYLLLQDLYSRSFARIAVVLLCCSPWFLFMAMSLMSHTATLTFALSAIVLLAHGRSSRSHIFAFLAGMLVGTVSLIRPLDGAIVAVLLGVWCLASNEGLKRKLASAVALTFGTASTALLILPYNLMVTGQAGLLPIDSYYDKYFWPKVMALGFGPERGMGWELDAFPGHSPPEAIINAALNVYQLNTELFGWASGSLILIALLFFSGRVCRKDLWAWITITAVVGVYGLYWYHGGPDFGARYWFLSSIPLIALTVSGIRWISSTISNQEDAESDLNPRVVLAVVVLCVMSMVAYIPWRSTDKYFAYLGMQPGIQNLAQQNNFGKSLVLIRGSEHPDYQSAWIYNPLNFEGDEPIYAHDKNPETRARLLRDYSDRPVWIVDGPSIANGEYRITQGPLDSSIMLADQKKSKLIAE